MTVAHKRDRHALACLLKKMKFSPVVSIQGPRQCGKSFLAREILPEKISKSSFVSLDQKKARSFAETNPETFLSQGFLNDETCLIIDEAQKAPDLFDEIKHIVDLKRTPGQFVLLGSTEFSTEVKVRESLTGRLSRLRLFPFNLSECLKLPMNMQKSLPFCNSASRIERRDLLRYLNNGGFPGIFAVKSESEKASLFSDWLNLTCERDIHQLKKFKLDPDICRTIIEAIGMLEDSSAVNIAKQIGMTTRSIEKYLNALKTLFVIFEVKPFRGSAGKSKLYLTDVGLANHLGAGFEKKLTTWFYIEVLSQCSYKNIDVPTLHFYKTPRGSPIHLMFEDEKNIIAVKLTFHEGYDERDFLIFDNLQAKLKTTKAVKKLVLSGASNKLKHKDIDINPWEIIA